MLFDVVARQQGASPSGAGSPLEGSLLIGPSHVESLVASCASLSARALYLLTLSID